MQHSFPTDAPSIFEKLLNVTSLCDSLFIGNEELAKKQIESGVEFENLYKCSPLNVAAEKGTFIILFINLSSFLEILAISKIQV